MDIFSTVTSTSPSWDDAKCISASDLMDSIIDVQKQLNEYHKKMLDSAQEIFKECFGADYMRGDVIVFPKTRKATFDKLSQELPPQMMEQIKLDHIGALESPKVINGDYLPLIKPMSLTLQAPTFNQQ